MSHRGSFVASRPAQRHPVALRRRLLPPALLGLALCCSSLTACTGEDESGSGGTTTTTMTTSATGCALAEVELADGRCQPPGLPLDMSCPPGETPLGDGSCQAAGVPPAQCGDGFEADGESGCRPILPEKPCPYGLLAVPGETECHEVAPCGTGPWGDIPVGVDTEHVDGSYAGNDSDGTPGKPWKTIQDGLNAAAMDAVVAVAAGTYQEDLGIVFKRKRLWGRCPSMVTVEGVDPMGAVVFGASSGSEIHNLALTGPSVGVYVDGPDEFLLDAVWIHDTGSAGVLVDGPASATVRSSLIEHVREKGLEAVGASLTVERSAVRDVLPVNPVPWQINSVAVSGFPKGSWRASLTLRSSIVERTTDDAIFMLESDALVEGVAVREVMPAFEAGEPGRVSVGLQAVLSDLTLRGSTFERISYAIVLDGTRAMMERLTVIRGLSPPTNPLGEEAVLIDDYDGTASKVTLRESIIADNPDFAIEVLRSSALIESTLVRNNVQNFAQVPASAVSLDEATDTTIRHSVIAGNQFIGLRSAGGEVLFEASVVRDMQLGSSSGACVVLLRSVDPGAPPGSLTLRSSLLDHCGEIGAVTFGANLVVETSVVREVVPNGFGLLGDGISVVREGSQIGKAKLTGVRIEAVDRAGVSAFASQVEIGFSSVSCAKFDLAGEDEGGATFHYEKLGDNACGCPDATELCKVVSPGLSPPELPPPPQPPL